MPTPPPLTFEQVLDEIDHDDTLKEAAAEVATIGIAAMLWLQERKLHPTAADVVSLTALILQRARERRQEARSLS